MACLTDSGVEALTAHRDSVWRRGLWQVTGSCAWAPWMGPVSSQGRPHSALTPPAGCGLQRAEARATTAAALAEGPAPATVIRSDCWVARLRLSWDSRAGERVTGPGRQDGEGQKDGGGTAAGGQCCVGRRVSRASIWALSQALSSGSL